MASSKWKTWDEIEAIARARRIVFWGASHWIERTRERLGPIGEYIVDNNPNNQNTQYADMPVKAPQALKEDARGICIVITTSNYNSVIDELHEMGFVMGEDFFCTPLLMGQSVSDDLRGLDKKVLITSPQHFSDEKSGGGLYLFETKGRKLRKLIGGKCRGLAAADDGFLLVDMLGGVRILDKDFNQTGLLELPPKCEPHGITFDPATKLVFVAHSGRDAVGIYELDSGKAVDEIFISEKWKANSKDNHHINDLWVVEDSLFVGVFSISGNWMHEVYDGGVLEISIAKKQISGVAITGLWSPHSVSRFGGKLVVLDSMRGELVTMNWKRLGQFNTFARGLSFDGQYFYVGMSRFRHAEKLSGISQNIGVDAGFTVFDPSTRHSRTFVIDEFEVVHSVHVL